ncbi:MAG: hypothetical protein M1821_003765 [Bathelium mastoideum]|nr:MAG: hypothetical protein M1821_003765 [Bathelium mastoideum]
MADAPEAAFSADERFPKYPVTTNEEEVSIGSPSRLSPLEEHNNTLLETQYPTEKSRFTSPLRSQPSQPFLPSPALATTAPVSPWNQTSPPQYAVDTPTTPTRPAQFPTYITPERQDSARAPAAPQIKSIPAVQGGEEGKWRIGLCDCSGDGRLWCDVLWLPCVVAGRTHQRVKGVDPREIGSSSGYVSAALIFLTLSGYSIAARDSLILADASVASALHAAS